MPCIEHDGARLYYEDTGGEGPPVVFVHGFILDRTLWKNQTAALSGQYRCLALDGRGHGMSEANGPFTFWDSAGDVVALLDEVAIDRAVLVGHSQGGWTIQRVALKHPDRVAGLVLVSTTIHPFPPETAAGFRQMREAWVDAGPVGEVGETMAGIQFGGTDYDGSFWIEKWRSRAPREWSDAWSAILDRLDEEDVSGQFATVSVPVGIVHGTGDQAFRPALAEAARDILPNVQGLTLVEGAPHSLPLTHPDDMTGVLRSFLEAQSG